MITLATYGLGMLVGSWVSGEIVGLYTLGENQHDWTSIWLIPAAFAAFILVLFALFFTEKERKPATAVNAG
jgi:MFS family permease